MKLTAGLDGCTGKNGDHKNNECSVGDKAGDNAREHARHENCDALFLNDLAPEDLGGRHINKAGYFKCVNLDGHTDKEYDGRSAEVGVELCRFNNSGQP